MPEDWEIFKFEWADQPRGVLRIKQGRVIEASVGNQQLPSDRIVQENDRVLLMSARRQPIVALTVTPQARIEWEGRR